MGNEQERPFRVFIQLLVTQAYPYITLELIYAADLRGQST